MRRDDICIYVSRANRAQLEAIIADRNSASKAVWRADTVLATADGLGTNAIMRRVRKSKPCVWRWQERYIEEGVEGLLRDKTRPPGRKPLSAAIGSGRWGSHRPLAEHLHRVNIAQLRREHPVLGSKRRTLHTGRARRGSAGVRTPSQPV
jgi:hypothetical protein